MMLALVHTPTSAITTRFDAPRCDIRIRDANDDEIPLIARELCAPHLLAAPSSTALVRLAATDLTQ
eukprot:1081710-Prymnesium_polylepis.1